ncbi:aldehyde dehydrogenase family protein [Lysinibacillus agricola]|uniref:Aldehyde dehydrogenase family protein n=1 Tax=Lysinibacillus agricola TaxID=2590012 RepID=A0ABX7AL63_9BACI|nr:MULTISPECIES: aldehyde dehydrogenase family protein [Lysinibacillus]KOS59828.1 aldehyde dehydrogenase [Lysinibacillus sp. FJAT-14222]QQP10606.1 aldehyde dehydrogenase family protein [Lysinibacillus agricola]
MKERLYIDGCWVEAEVYADLYSPFSNEKIAEIPQASLEQVDDAIRSAVKNKHEIAEMTTYERARILERLTVLLTEKRDEAATLIALESAKPLKTAYGEVDRTIETYKFSAEEAKRNVGEIIPMDAAKTGAGRFGYTQKEPIGVVGAITPFNFPMNLVAHKLGPAIAVGNSVILKPATQTPLSAFFIARLLEEAGLPKGVLNVVTGRGSLVGDRIVTSDNVNMITFTGSPEVGKEIIAKAGLKKVSLELGSNAGVIIEDAPDLQKVAHECVIGAYSNQGQVCISLQRIYVMEHLYDEFLEHFRSEAAKLVCGDPLKANTDVSSLISAKDLTRSMNWIEEAKQQGANVLAGGIIENNVLVPTILTNVATTSKVSCQEVFAPIVTITPIESIQEGIAQVNNSKYGLQAGIFTQNIHTAFEASKKLQVGGVMINDIPTYRVDQMPYGGVKESGNTKEGIKYAMEEMTETKLIVWNQN